MTTTQTTEVEQLNPLSFPLHGSRLIEASAGTGKTFTLALLYVRLILGQSSNGQGFSRPLTPKEILVVTFTELAAGELRDRIRARLVEVAEYFKQPDHSADSLLVDLRDDYPAAEWPRCAWRLQMAAESMDEASVSTIHSWCNRMLVEHTFDTRGLFSRELVTDTSELLSEVVEDYWRVHFYSLNAGQAKQVLKEYQSPAQLEKDLANLIKPTSQGVSFIGQAVQPNPQLLTDILTAKQARQQIIDSTTQAAQEYWATHWADIQAYLLELQPYLNGNTHGSAKLDKFTVLLDEIQAWAQDNGPQPSKLSSFAEGAFKFKAKAKIDQVDQQLEAFKLIREMNEAAQTEPGLSVAAALLADAAHWVKNTFQQRMAQHAQMSFDDLLVQLEKALDPELAGEHALQLAATLKRNYPIAMIDEFQDTDPIQYSIFNRIYQVQQSSADSGIFMIGDPKQSIYSFRGADIHTYLKVRSATQGRHYTLKKNFRSTIGVVDACNAFFAQAEQHPQAAFRYKTPEQNDNPIPFIEVSAQGRENQLYLDHQAVDPMTLWYFSAEDPAQPLSMSDFRQNAAAVAASQISAWLNSAATGATGFGKEGGVEQALQPADIAILVRTGTEAQQMTQALRERGIASVYMSDREALLVSQEAADLLHWLYACAEPTDARLVKAALGTFTLGLPLSRLAQWQEDELAWEDEMQQFSKLHLIWRKQGILVMLQRLMAYYQLPARLLQQPKGERSLTNLLHLAEWLQQAASQIDGEQALIRYLYEHLGKDNQQLLLRLESDARRVKILTIHKSKGLEFPLVLLPFISCWRETSGKDKQVTYHQGDQIYTEVAGKSNFSEAWTIANDERIKEDLRLLYVALTRASHALWLGVGALKSGNAKTPQLEKSAIGYMLNAGQAFKSPDEVYSALTTIAEHASIKLVEAPEITDLQAPQLSETVLEEARPAPHLGHLSNWWIASYSALQFAGHNAAVTPADNAEDDLAQQTNEPSTAHEDQLLELAQSSLDTTTLLTPQRQTEAALASNDFMHQFPRGPKWGTFLHSLLEWAAVTRGTTEHSKHLRGFSAAAADDAGRDAMLASRCKLRKIEHFAEPLSLWIKDFIQQQWQPTGFALTDLTPANLAVELEFLIEVHKVSAQQLDQLVRPYTVKGASAPQAKHTTLNGMLKGFIDLVAEKDGQYYVIDWKSNYLGASDEDYSQAAMHKAILEHRYDLQYLLYILALHRQLKARLPEYDYDQHVGGAVYVFLRGWQNPSTQGLFHDKPPKALIEALDALFSRALLSQSVSSDAMLSHTTAGVHP